MEERKKVEIKLDISAVSNKCMIHIQEITNCLTLIHQAINHSNIDIIKLLPTNSLPIHIETLMPKPTIEEQKEIAINWILTKAFEEFVNGLTKGLKEAYRSLKFYEFALKPNDSLSEEDIIS
jgi:hypothetical protein